MPAMSKFDHSDIDGRLMQVLLAVFEEQSVTRAAARLDVTPRPFDCPAVPMYRLWCQRHHADPMHQWLHSELQAVVAPALAAAELRPAAPKAA